MVNLKMNFTKKSTQFITINKLNLFTNGRPSGSGLVPPHWLGSSLGSISSKTALFQVSVKTNHSLRI